MLQMNANAPSTEDLIAWASLVVNVDQHHPQLTVSIMAETPWSKVLKISNQNQTYYLKQTPPDLFIEAELVRWIKSKYPDFPVPNILFINPELHCFIMESVGDYSLRTKLDGVIDEQLIVSGFNTYRTVQQSMQVCVNDLISLGVPDWKIKRLPDLYAELVNNRSLLIEEGMNTEQIDKLQLMSPQISKLCDDIDSFGFVQTLVNADYNENNVVFDESTTKLSVIDWGESVISHPFFSIASHLQSIARRYQLNVNSAAYDRIKRQLIGLYDDQFELDVSMKHYQTLEKIHPLFFALSLFRLQSATQSTSKQQQNWFIKGILDDLINKFHV